MAATGDDYNRGGMTIAEQKETFSGFMSLTVWGSALTAAIVFALTLIFAAGVAWPVGVLSGAAVGVVAGLVLGLKTGWYAVVVALTVLGFIIGGVAELAHGLTAG